MSKPKTWCYICLSFPHFYLSQILIPRTHIQYQSPFPHVYFQPESSLWTPKRHPNTFLISLPVWPISVSRSHYSELFTWSQTCSKPHYSLIQLLRPKRFASSLTFIKKITITCSTLKKHPEFCHLLASPLLICIRVQLCLTLWYLIGFPRQEYWHELPFPPPGDLPDAGNQTQVSCIAGGLFTTEPPGKHHPPPLLSPNPSHHDLLFPFLLVPAQ